MRNHFVSGLDVPLCSFCSSSATVIDEGIRLCDEHEKILISVCALEGSHFGEQQASAGNPPNDPARPADAGNPSSASPRADSGRRGELTPPSDTSAAFHLRPDLASDLEQSAKDGRIPKFLRRTAA